MYIFKKVDDLIVNGTSTDHEVPIEAEYTFSSFSDFKTRVGASFRTESELLSLKPGDMIRMDLSSQVSTSTDDYIYIYSGKYEDKYATQYQFDNPIGVVIEFKEIFSFSISIEKSSGEIVFTLYSDLAGSNSVSTTSIQDSAVTTEKLSDFSVTLEKLSKELQNKLMNMYSPPSGDPFHYMYEKMGAEWIPYDQINTTGLEDWQIATLDMETAQKDKGVWWHNEIFASVLQNYLNYQATSPNIRSTSTSDPKLQQFFSSLSHKRFTTNYLQENKYSFYISSGSVTPNYSPPGVLLSAMIGAITINVLDLRLAPYGTDTLISNSWELVKVIGVIDVKTHVTGTLTSIVSFRSGSSNGVPYSYTHKIKHISIKNLSGSVDVNLPELSMESLEFMIVNADHSEGVTTSLKLAANIYEEAVANEQIQQALESHPDITLLSY